MWIDPLLTMCLIQTKISFLNLIILSKMCPLLGVNDPGSHDRLFIPVLRIEYLDAQSSVWLVVVVEAGLIADHNNIVEGTAIHAQSVVFR